jgi:flagellar hook-length control protein FliK
MSANVASLWSSNGPAAPPIQPAKPLADDGSQFTNYLDRAKAAADSSNAAKADDRIRETRGTERKTNPSAAAAKGSKKNKDETAVDESESGPDTAETGDAKVDAAGDAPANDSQASPQTEEPQGNAKELPTGAHVKTESAGVNGAGVPSVAPIPIQATLTAGHAAVPENKASTTAITPGVEPVAGSPAATSGQASVIPTAEANAKAQETAAAFDANGAKPQAGGNQRVATVSPLDAQNAVDPKASAAVKPSAVPATAATTNAPPADAAINPVAGAVEAGAIDKHIETIDAASVPASLLAQGATATPPQNSNHAPTAVAQPPIPPEVRFAEANHAGIVNSVQTNLLPHGGTMLIRLDPPELGALQVTVEMRDGTMNATFQTSNESATQLLSHSLGQLKTALEAQGVTVDKIQVQQAPKNQSSQNQGESSPQQQRDEAAARQDQQRKEMLRQMWRKVSGGTEPMDLVA